MNIDKRGIENRALQILEAYNISKPVVDVAKIAKGENLNIKEINMPEGYEGVAGFYNKDERTIYVEVNDTPNRKLFSIAHELGHIFLNHQHATVLFRVTHDDTIYTEKEKEANIFAADLLMPDLMVKEYLEKYNLSRSDYKEMAEIFGVPVSSMKHTLDFLK